MDQSTYRYGPHFYDDPEVFSRYQEERSGIDEGNATLEEPYVFDYLESVVGFSVLDLGCGDGRFGVEITRRGAARYLGVDGSSKMLELASRRLPGALLAEADLNDWEAPEPGQWDIVTARMVVHYLDELDRFLTEVRRALAPGGRFVMSVEHPVVTCAYEGEWASGIARRMNVERYFKEGGRNCAWLGSSVRKQHRTLQTYVTSLLAAGFLVTGVSEGAPRREHFTDGDTYAARQDVPMYLVLRADVPAAR
ncbi:class I SAM-dependent methyltransferase [Streptomyces sp. NPDC003016]